MDNHEIAQLLDYHQREILTTTTAATLTSGFWAERYGESLHEKVLFDSEHSLANLTKTLRYRSPMLLDDYIRWLRSHQPAQGYTTGIVRTILAELWTAIARTLPAEMHPPIYRAIQQALKELDYTSDPAQAVALCHERSTEAVVSRTYDAHWHWQHAYAQQGRERMMFDVWLTLDYLTDALGLSSASALTGQVRWLRNDALKRGLSTVHIQQLLWIINTAVAEQNPPIGGTVQRVLETASSALLPESEAGRALLAAQDAVVGEVAHTLANQGIVPTAEQAAPEVGWAVAYLSDSMARNDASLLHAYRQRMQQWFAQAGIPDTPLREMFRLLDAALAQHLPTYAAQQARQILQQTG